MSDDDCGHIHCRQGHRGPTHHCIRQPGHTGPHGDFNGLEWVKPEPPPRFGVA